VTGSCVCNGGYRRPSKTLSESSSFIECTPCAIGNIRPAEKADDEKSIFQDTDCSACLTFMEIENEADRSAFENWQVHLKRHQFRRILPRLQPESEFSQTWNSVLIRNSPVLEVANGKLARKLARAHQNPCVNADHAKSPHDVKNGTLVAEDGYWFLTVEEVVKERKWTKYDEDKRLLEEDGLDKLIRADILIKCDNVIACKDGKCNDELGYSGYLCTRCKDGWGKSAGKLCAQCPNPAWIAPILAFLIATGILGNNIHARSILKTTQV